MANEFKKIKTILKKLLSFALTIIVLNCVCGYSNLELSRENNFLCLYQKVFAGAKNKKQNQIKPELKTVPNAPSIPTVPPETASWSKWNGDVSSALSGTGSSGSPYLINSAADLAYLQSLSGGSSRDKYYVLNINIDLDEIAFTSICNEEWNGFHGDFNGNGYWITNLNVSGERSGLFAVVGSYAQIHDLNVVVHESSGNCAGGIAGLAKLQTEGGYTTTINITNCNTFGKIGYGTSASNAMYAGGIVGRNYATNRDSQINISNCISSATVRGKYNDSNVGGIVGENYSDTSGNVINIDNCYYYGDDVSGDRVGGIVGADIMSNETAQINISNCHSTGSITSTNGSTDTSACSGGIVGYSRAQNRYNVYSISNCSHHDGTVASDKYAGGILGCSNVQQSNMIFTMQNCYNTASVTSNEASGGILGAGAVSNPAQKLYIHYCYNTGEIDSMGNAGGIVGYLNYAKDQFAMYIACCYNIGNVNGNTSGSNYGVGGIIGNNCVSGGKSIAGYCYNTGHISGKDNIGGIIGINRNTNNNYGIRIGAVCCYNTGKVEAINSTRDTIHQGGIIGYNTTFTNTEQPGYKVVQNCYDNQDISGQSTLVGGNQSSGDIINVSGCTTTQMIGETADSGNMIGLFYPIKDLTFYNPTESNIFSDETLFDTNAFVTTLDDDINGYAYYPQLRYFKNPEPETKRNRVAEEEEKSHAQLMSEISTRICKSIIYNDTLEANLGETFTLSYNPQAGVVDSFQYQWQILEDGIWEDITGAIE